MSKGVLCSSVPVIARAALPRPADGPLRVESANNASSLSGELPSLQFLAQTTVTQASLLQLVGVGGGAVYPVCAFLFT